MLVSSIHTLGSHGECDGTSKAFLPERVHLDPIVRGGGVQVGQTRASLVQTGSGRLWLGLLWAFCLQDCG